VPDTTLAMIAACLWDLRAQCEDQLRCLTDAQRLNDDYREGVGQLLVQGRLHANLEGVLRANTVIREGAVDCLRLITELPGNRSAPSAD
jgi:hypothetical protein